MARCEPLPSFVKNVACNKVASRVFLEGEIKMAEIKLNQEIITALQNCKDAKSVMDLAKEKGIELSEEKAGKIFAMLQNEEISDEELELVSGGGGCGCFGHRKGCKDY